MSEIEASVSKHQTWVWPVIIALSITAFVIGWVKVSSIMANKDITIAKINANH